MAIVFREWKEVVANYRFLSVLEPDFQTELRTTAEVLAKAVKRDGKETVLFVRSGEDGKPKIIFGFLSAGAPVRLFSWEAMRVIFRPNGEMSVSVQPLLMGSRQ